MSTAPRSQARPVEQLVGRHAANLQRGYRDDDARAVATLARLRRGAGRDPMAAPDLWGLIDIDELRASGQFDHEAALQRAENAVYAALALFALHQQSVRTRDVHKATVGLGEAVRGLMRGDESDEPIRKRFVRAGAAGDFGQLTVRLRELVSLFRRNEAIRVDYGLLADQLRRWQSPYERDAVRREWGRSFHRFRKADTDTTPDEK